MLGRGIDFMAAQDKIHLAVKNSLIKDGWTITDDPYSIKYEDVNLQADLAATRTLAAEKEGQKIVVEVKSFLSPSPINDLKVALGQYDLYFFYLRLTSPEHKLYLAISDTAYQRLLDLKGLELILQDRQMPLIIINVNEEKIVSWIN
jgi:CRISPR/Cas system-associated exonuclease Cas4 (RecB family)